MRQARSCVSLPASSFLFIPPRSLLAFVEKFRIMSRNHSKFFVQNMAFLLRRTLPTKKKWVWPWKSESDKVVETYPDGDQPFNVQFSWGRRHETQVKNTTGFRFVKSPYWQAHREVKLPMTITYVLSAYLRHPRLSSTNPSILKSY